MREILLDTAVDHFGRCGFEGASTRAIAQASGTAMSSITYHFGGKDGLYLAAAEHIAGQISHAHGPALAQIKAQPAATAAEATQALLALLDQFATMMLAEKSASWARFIIREQQEPTEAFDCIYRIAMQPVLDVFLSLIPIVRPDLCDEEARATGFLLFGQVIGMRAGRETLCRVLGVKTIAGKAEALMRARLAAHTRTILSARPENAE